MTGNPALDPVQADADKTLTTKGAPMTLTTDQLADLSAAAWLVRQNAKLYGKTAVGCAVLSADGRIFAGCNIEHRYRSHCIHAEPNALSSMVAAGSERAVALLIAAERELFTPCGSCLDWIFELGGPEAMVYAEATAGSGRSSYRAADLMPHYPR